MKKHVFLLTLSALLMVGCAGNESSSSLSSFSSSSSSSESSTPKTDAEYLEALGEKLLSLEGKISKSSSTMKRLFSYIGGLEIYVEDEYTTTRYVNDGSYVKETIGTTAIEDEDPLAYKQQVFDNGKKFYKIKVYEDDDSTTEQSSSKYAASSAESVYDVGQAYTEIANFNYMMEKANGDTTVYSFENIEGVIKDNKLSYSYSLSFYETDEDSSEEEKTLSQCIAYENTFTIKDGLITHLSQKYQSDVYAGDSSQTVIVNLDEDYKHNEYSTFSGTLFTIGKDSN